MSMDYQRQHDTRCHTKMIQENLQTLNKSEDYYHLHHQHKHIFNACSAWTRFPTKTITCFILFNPHNHPRSHILLLFLFLRLGVRDVTGLKPALDHTNKRQQMQDLNSTVCVLKTLYVAFRTGKMTLKGCFSTGFSILVYKDRIRNNDISLKVLYFVGPSRISQICGLLEGNHRFKGYVENGT